MSAGSLNIASVGVLSHISSNSLFADGRAYMWPEMHQLWPQI